MAFSSSVKVTCSYVFAENSLNASRRISSLVFFPFISVIDSLNFDNPFSKGISFFLDK